MRKSTNLRVLNLMGEQISCNFERTQTGDLLNTELLLRLTILLNVTWGRQERKNMPKDKSQIYRMIFQKIANEK